MSTYIILLGAPGAGKGTQSELIQQSLGLAHVSSGELFRENVSKQTPLGKLAKQYMDKGELVPDDLTVKMVMERIKRPDCKRGVVFDGFPRTEGQAKALDLALASEQKRIGAVVLFEIPDQVLVDRLSARRVCPKDGSVYNLFTNPPKIDGVCDKDGARLEQRDDDKPETVRRRLQVYQTQTKPLIEYYNRAELLKKIRGDQSIVLVQKDLVAAVKGL
jgi:adenylate kinase